MNKLRLLLVFLLFGSPFLLKAQSNFVATTPLSATPGLNNTVVGPLSGNETLTGRENTFLGYYSGRDNTTGFYNVFIGAKTGISNTTGVGNAFLGQDTGLANTEGGLNSFVGHAAGKANTTGSYNTFLGYQAGFLSISGGINTFVGYASGYANSSGSLNVFVGTQAGNQNATGTGNTCLGHQAGFSNNATNNTLIGYRADVNAPGLTNAAAIGANARVSVSNAIVLGDSVASTKVGIGLTAPQFPLDVNGIINIRGSGTLKFSHLSNPTLQHGTTDQFLTVNEQGETSLATYRLRVKTVADWSDKVFDKAYRLPHLTDVARYVGQHKHLPGLPSAQEMVSRGISLEQLNALLLEKIEELTLYSIQLEKTNQQQGRDLEGMKTQYDQKIQALAIRQSSLEQQMQTILMKKK